MLEQMITITQLALEIQEELTTISSSLRNEIDLISVGLEHNDDIISRLKDELEMLSEQTLQYIDSSGWKDMEENQPGIQAHQSEWSHPDAAVHPTDSHGALGATLWRDIVNLGHLSNGIRQASTERERRMRILVDHLLSALHRAYSETTAEQESAKSCPVPTQGNGAPVYESSLNKENRTEEAPRPSAARKTNPERLENERFRNRAKVSMVKIGLLQLSNELKQFSEEADSLLNAVKASWSDLAFNTELPRKLQGYLNQRGAVGDWHSGSKDWVVP
ncbi:hypothetical protein GUITHDRAFT_109131 [Guillardia theta CCMP2712]|uniref:Uncharacterized protein n=1 Tax=Guillardia theta (strain CCMP2712) TaxID=905079 RepID=L1JAG3_GUITC|nr:hypothetical protein GUITHDRAFT_109131 [Guillardia theta CCMP2712]EKX45085.1 hypothetical protein GUITHDRAFT_109131 [Guillardia theta CCMP2712]|eukprot:XP_005832065.1 hypothetical protein GUITHDRAFT_109131 [Guillardia theta CCMP2712]